MSVSLPLSAVVVVRSVAADTTRGQQIGRGGGELTAAWAACAATEVVGWARFGFSTARASGASVSSSLSSSRIFASLRPPRPLGGIVRLLPCQEQRSHGLAAADCAYCRLHGPSSAPRARFAQPRARVLYSCTLQIRSRSQPGTRTGETRAQDEPAGRPPARCSCTGDSAYSPFAMNR